MARLGETRQSWAASGAGVIAGVGATIGRPGTVVTARLCGPAATVGGCVLAAPLAPPQAPANNRSASANDATPSANARPRNGPSIAILFPPIPLARPSYAASEPRERAAAGQRARPS